MSLINEFTLSESQLSTIIFSAAIVYFTAIIYTRIIGLRSFSKMSSFDFANTIALGSIVGTVIVSSTVNILTGLIGLGMLYVLQWLVALGRRLTWVSKAIDNNPTLLMQDGRILEKNLRACKVTEDDLRAKLREANVLQLSQVKAVIFETTGDISVMHGDECDLDEWLLSDVMW